MRLVWLSHALGLKIRSSVFFQNYTSKLGTYELSGKPNLLPFSVSPDFLRILKINVLWAAAPSIILPDTTYYTEVMRRARAFRNLASNGRRTLDLNMDFYREEIKDILDKVDRRGRRVGQICLVE